MTGRRRIPQPFRLFFPLGVLLGLAGGLPWVLFGRGLLHQWPGMLHAQTMTQGFLLAFAAGFLGTMLPRRTNTAPMSVVEAALLVASLVAIPTLLLSSPAWTSWRLIASQGAYLIALGTLATFAVRRLLAAGADRPAAPPSFIMIPIGLLAGVGGAALLIAYALGAPIWAWTIGRGLTQQGLLLSFVLAVVPLVNPIISRGEPPDPRRRGRGTVLALRALYAGAGLLLLASFVVEQEWSQRAGLWLRAGICLAGLAASGAFHGALRPGLHRALFRLALPCVPIGLLAAGLAPAARVPFLHVTLVGGLALLTLAVSVHVVVMHGGREALADRWPWLVVAAAALLVAAAAVRVVAERAFADYFVALTLAGSLWLAATVMWGLFLSVIIARPRRESGP
jgi:uncharacterized protein involved in response to NO